MPFQVIAYDPSWPVLFAAEQMRLEPALAPWAAAELEHIGSTSIPGMPAKPVIDMLAGVRELSGARAAIPVLQRLGYAHAEHRPDALHFFAPVTDDVWAHTHHLHLTEVGSGLWRERLAFRDELRADPLLVQRYAQLKRQLVHDAGGGYDARGKREFVAEVLARAGFSYPPDLTSGLPPPRSPPPPRGPASPSRRS